MESAGGPQAKRGRSKSQSKSRSKRPPRRPDVEEKHTSGGHQAERGQTKRPLPAGSDVEGKHTSGCRGQTKRGRTERSLPDSDVDEKQEKHTSTTLTRSEISVSKNNRGHQTIHVSQSRDANGLVCDRKIDREMLDEVTEKHPEILSQFLDDLKKESEAHNLEITNLIHEERSALQKSNEVLSLRLHVVFQDVIVQLEDALENSVDEVDHGFNNCFKELKANKSSVCGVKQGFVNCLQEIRRINCDTSLLIVDLQTSSWEHDSSEKNLKQAHDNGGHQNQGGQLANGLVCGVERSISRQPAEAERPFPDSANRKWFARQNLFRMVGDVVYDRKIYKFYDKIYTLNTELRRFLDGQDSEHDIEIANLRAQCLSLYEERSVLKKTNEVLQNRAEQLNLSSKVVCQNIISQLEAAQKFVDEVEHVFNNRRKELKAERNYVCGLVKRGFNYCLQQIRQIKSDTPVVTSMRLQKSSGDHKFSVKSEPDHANGEMSGICGSYSDDAATPTLLQAALSNARVAVNRLEKVVSKVKKSREDKTGGMQTPEPGSNVFFARPTHSGYYVKSVVNRLFFQGFENESFNTLLGISRFLNPNLRQQNFYEYFLQERDHPDNNDIEDPQFKEFCQVKISSLLGIILSGSTETRMEISSLEELGDRQLALSFRGAARSVWLLHKLAFSLEPPAAIFRVEAGIDVDPDYMETVVDLDDSENFVSKVGFMIAPGLRLRNTIMRCEVYLAAATKTSN